MVEPVTRDPQYAPYADGPGGPFRWRLALRPLDVAEWLELGEHYERDIARKRDVQSRHPGTVFAAIPEALAACAEVRDAIVDHLVDRFPDHFTRDGGVLVNHRLGERVVVDDPEPHPLETAARLVQEDLIVMIDAPGGAEATHRHGRHAGELVFAAGSAVLPGLFTTDRAVLDEIAVPWWFLVGQLTVAGIVFALDGVLLGAGDAKFMRNATLLSAVFGFLPLIWLSLGYGWGLVGIWSGLSLFMVLRLVFVGWRTFSGRWLVAGTG